MAEGPKTVASLLDRLRESEEAAWQEFWTSYRPYIEGVLRNRGTPRDKLDDRVQDVMVRLVAAMPEFRYDPERGRFRSWLARVVGGLSADYGRAQAKRPAVVGGTDFQGRLAEVPDAGADAQVLSPEESAELCDQLDRAIVDGLLAEIRERWPARYRLWRLLVGPPKLDALEVAEQTGATVGSVYQARHVVEKYLEAKAQEIRAGRISSDRAG